MDDRIKRWATANLKWVFLAYCIAVLVLLVFLRACGDKWWPVTPLLYGPMWLAAVPLIFLIPAAIVYRQRLLWILLLLSILFNASLMKLKFHWSGAPPAHSMAFLTANVDGEPRTAEGLLAIMSHGHVDFLGMQECPPDHPIALMKIGEWDIRAGRGLCIASHFPIRYFESMQDEHNWRDVMMRCDVDTPQGVVHVFNVHLETPRKEIEAFMGRSSSAPGTMQQWLSFRQRQARAVRDKIDEVSGPKIVMGDFNLIEMSRIYQQNFGDFNDAFDCTGLGTGHTKMLKLWGTRIDHILTRDGMVPEACEVQKDVGSDHLPFMAWVTMKGK
jgi:vancomycin resistance protein VanJ